jgi:uncharacterized protein
MITTIKEDRKVLMVSRAFRKGVMLFWLIASVYIVLIGLYGLESFFYTIYKHYQITLTMALGSFVAGGTALGGGAVAFPVMTKVLFIDVQTAKTFSLAVQSFGMSAAALTIVSRNIPYYKAIVLMALPMATLGVVMSLLLLAPITPRLFTKAIFSCFLLCFAITLLVRRYRKVHHVHSCSEISPSTVRFSLVAFIGGLASGLVGSGADIAIFALLVLAYSVNIKKATATAVIIMAFTSVIGSLVNWFVLGAFTPILKEYLLAAIPIVIIGAPFGAYVCAKVSEQVMIYLLLVLILLEVGFTAFEIL